MAEEVTPPETPEGAETPEEKPDVEKAAFLERLGKESGKRKEAEKTAADTLKKLTEMQALLDERESAGLPELERLKKDMERATKRAEEAEQRAQAADAKVARTQKQQWVTAAAKDFADPSDAAAFLDLDTIEDEKDAERAVKRLATTKKHLLKTEEPVLPGQVLKNGKQPEKAGGFDVNAEAQKLADGLKQFASKQ